VIEVLLHNLEVLDKFLPTPKRARLAELHKMRQARIHYHNGRWLLAQDVGGIGGPEWDPARRVSHDIDPPIARHT